jgi:uncharacterized protein YlxW (UPF0749 family)
MLVFGLLLTTQFRTTTTQRSTDPSKLRADELAAALKASEEALKASDAERKRLASENQRLQESLKTLTPPPSVDQKRLEALVGATILKGPGVVVTLTGNESGSVKKRVSDEDLWRVVNELLAAGGEGVAINGQRISTLTPIRNVGNRIMVGQTLVSSPVEIAAIGDPKVLEAAMLLRGGVSDVLAHWGVKLTVRQVDSIELPAIHGLPSFQFAKPQ